MRVYSVVMNQISVSAAKTLISVVAPSTAIVVLLRAWITQDASETSEQLPILIQRGSAIGTGTAATPDKFEPGDPVAASTVKTNLTVEPTYTGNPFVNESFNVLNGFLYVPMPEERIILPPSGVVGMRLDANPAAALTMSAGFVFGEIG